MKNILITGAAGLIGNTLREALRGVYPLLRLSDIRPLDTAAAGEECIAADLGDFAAVAAMMRDIDCVVHLGGVPKEGPWDIILNANIAGTYNMFEAARLAGVKRVVFASSNHVIGYYRADKTVGVDEPPRPDSRYGVSKVFGEALGRLYADKHGMSVACLRIGSFRERPEDARQLATWISPRDMAQLVRCAIDAPPHDFIVLYGVSGNTRSRWENPAAADIGYQPQDNAEDYAAQFAAPPADGSDPAVEFHGGGFCTIELRIKSLDWRRAFNGAAGASAAVRTAHAALWVWSPARVRRRRGCPAAKYRRRIRCTDNTGQSRRIRRRGACRLAGCKMSAAADAEIFLSPESWISPQICGCHSHEAEAERSPCRDSRQMHRTRIDRIRDNNIECARIPDE